MSLTIQLTEKPIGDMQVYESNITSNLLPIWKKLKIDDILYNTKVQKASKYTKQLINAYNELQNIETMGIYKALLVNSTWGTYNDALNFLHDLIIAIEDHPNAKIHNY